MPPTTVAAEEATVTKLSPSAVESAEPKSSLAARAVNRARGSVAAPTAAVGAVAAIGGNVAASAGAAAANVTASAGVAAVNVTSSAGAAAVNVTAKATMATTAATAKAAKEATRQFKAGFARLPIWGEPGATQISHDLNGSQQGATTFEIFRDTVLKTMAAWEPLFAATAILCGIGLVGFGLLIVILLFPVQLGVSMGGMTELIDPACNVSQYNQTAPAGTYGHIEFRGSSQYPPRVRGVGTITEFGNAYYVAMACTNAQIWFNVCIKFFAFYFGYINLLQLPWTVSIFMNAHFPRKDAPQVGVDFYGRPSESLWFHLPRSTRSLVASLLLFSLIAQTCAVIFHLMWFSYLAGQTFPGALLQNIWIPLQLGTQIAASNVQSKAEKGAREAYPGRFPPALDEYLKAAFTRWRADVKERGGRSVLCCCCGDRSFLAFLVAEMNEFNKESARFGKVAGLSGVHADAIDDEADVRRDMPQEIPAAEKV